MIGEANVTGRPMSSGGQCLFSKGGQCWWGQCWGGQCHSTMATLATRPPRPVRMLGWRLMKCILFPDWRQWRCRYFGQFDGVLSSTLDPGHVNWRNCWNLSRAYCQMLSDFYPGKTKGDDTRDSHLWNVTPLLGHFGGRVGICNFL